MSEVGQNIADAVPCEITKSGTDTDGEYVRFEVTVHPAIDADAPDDILDHERFLIDNPDEHVHPHQKEIIEVITGKYAVEFEGTEHHLSGGEEITVPANTPHRHWNPSADPARVAHEHHPPLDSAEHVETMYELAQAGKTDEKGIPNPLRFAVVNKAYPGVAYTTAIPIPVQKALFTVLAPIGRLVGIQAGNSRKE